jgi:hypothetical protein
MRDGEEELASRPTPQQCVLGGLRVGCVHRGTDQASGREVNAIVGSQPSLRFMQSHDSPHAHMSRRR